MSIPTKLHPTDLQTIAAMCEKGHFHAHQDGRWRYSPFGGETHYCSDPTTEIRERTEIDGCACGIDRDANLFFIFHRDGTRGLQAWDAKLQWAVWHRYGGGLNPTHTAQMQWIMARMPAPARPISA